MIKKLFILLILSIFSDASELTAMEKACKRGVAEACHDLGILYGGDNGLKANAKKEKAYLLQGCDLDSDKACIDLENVEITDDNDE